MRSTEGLPAAGLVRLAAAGVALAVLVGGCGGLKRWAYSGSDRDDWQKPDQVIAALELQPGQRVADLGAGGGYFTFRLADAVGESGRVYAVDVDPSMLEYLRDEAEAQGRDNVEVVEAELDDPNLPGPVDLVFTVNTYHHLEDRPTYFANAARYLEPGGRLAVIELSGKGWFSRWFGHNTPPDRIQSELEQAGYRRVAAPDFLDQQSFQIFEVETGPRAPGR